MHPQRACRAVLAVVLTAGLALAMVPRVQLGSRSTRTTATVVTARHRNESTARLVT